MYDIFQGGIFYVPPFPPSYGGSCERVEQKLRDLRSFYILLFFTELLTKPV
jgi:hypothetical protein